MELNNISLNEFFYMEGYNFTLNEVIKYYKENAKMCKMNKIQTESYLRDVKINHKIEVLNAYKKGIELRNEVIEDYRGDIENIKNMNEKENKIYIDDNFIKALKEGCKLTIDDFKVTVVKIKENSIILRLYRKKKKGIELCVGDKINSYSLGWK